MRWALNETVLKVKGKRTVVGFVTDAATGQLLGMDVLVERDSEGFIKWLEGYVSRFGVEAMVTDDLSTLSATSIEVNSLVVLKDKVMVPRASTLTSSATQRHGQSRGCHGESQEDNRTSFAPHGRNW